MSFGWTPEDERLATVLAIGMVVLLVIAHTCTASQQAERPLTPPESLYASGGGTK